MTKTRFITFAGALSGGAPRVVVSAKNGRTKQSMKDECDVNAIVNRFNKTGLIAHLAKGEPKYLDVSEVKDYRTALEQVKSVGEFFRGLPAELRSEFGHDPAAFLDFATDPANAERMKEYGLQADGHDHQGDAEKQPAGAISAGGSAEVDQSSDQSSKGDGKKAEKDD